MHFDVRNTLSFEKKAPIQTPTVRPDGSCFGPLLGPLGPKPLSSGRTGGVWIAFGKCDYYAFSISNRIYSRPREPAYAC